MEQPPGSLDDLQPQDLSTSSIPTLIDLTRKGEECVLSATSLDALQMVKSPSWYPNSGTSNPGLPFPETRSTDVTHQSGDQIQPDNAFSRTTVTLSYVSRSHVFSTQHSPVYSMPPVSTFSLHPPCDSDKGLGETGYALNQHYLDQAAGPVDLATQTEILQSLSQAQELPENKGCVTELNGGVVSSDGDMIRHVQEGTVNCEALDNSQDTSLSSGVSADSPPEFFTPVPKEDEERGSSEVLFVLSKNQDPVVVPDSLGARDRCSLSREYVSPLEDPVSPSATSLDDVEDVFDLPQASSSPSADNSFAETAEDVVWDGLSAEASPGIRDGIPRMNSNKDNKQPHHRQKAVTEPLIDLTNDVGVSDVLEDKPKVVIPHMNGNAKTLQRTLKEKRLPVRSGRGTRLEAIVMNINSSRYKVSGCIRSSKKASASQTTASGCGVASPKKSDTLTIEERTGRVKTVKQNAVTRVKRGQTNSIKTDSCRDSTSNCETLSNLKKSLNDTRENPEELSHPVHSSQTRLSKSRRKTSPQPSPPSSAHKNSEKEPDLLPHSDPSVEIHAARFSPPPLTSPKKGQEKGKATGIKSSPTGKMKVARTPKRRQQKHKRSLSSSMFSPREPEIKLKYVNYKEEKRDLRSDNFSPFIRVEHQQSALSQCTVINYPEEARTQHRKGPHPQTHPGGFISAVVPSTSCLQLGQASQHSQHQRALVCCLCGQSANSMDLGDLHGPYYPEGYQPNTKTPASKSGLKKDEDDYSDSDSSSCSNRARGRKRAVPPTLRPLSKGAQLKQKGLLESHRRNSDRTSSPAAKRARTEGGSADPQDWFSPPVLPLEPREYWLHEDCGIWSAGVFLVRGKVYGLEEAVKVAQETVMMHFHPRDVNTLLHDPTQTHHRL